MVRCRENRDPRSPMTNQRRAGAEGWEHERRAAWDAAGSWWLVATGNEPGEDLPPERWQGVRAHDAAEAVACCLRLNPSDRPAYAWSGSASQVHASGVPMIVTGHALRWGA